MARTRVWTRSYNNLGTLGVDGFFRIAVLTPGETLVRVHLGMTISSARTNEFPWTKIGAWGVSRGPAGGSFPDLHLFNEQDDPNWLWWEGLHLDVQTPTRAAGAAANLPHLVGPASSRYRSIEAQRRNTTTESQDIWWQWAWFLGDGPPMYTFLTASCLILEAPDTT